MRILFNLSVAPILASELVASPQSAPKTQDNPSNNSIIKDIFWHPNGIGQRSSIGNRMFTPEQIQNMTPEQLEDWQKQQKRANAGMEAMKETANSVGNLLPTSEVVTIIPQIVISEGVERIVDANTKAPAQPPAQGKKEAESKTPSTESGSVGDTVPRTQPNPPQQDKSGLKLNPDYRGNFDDHGPTEKPRFWPEGPVQKPSTPKDPKKKVSIKITLSPDKNLQQQQIQLKARGLVSK